MNVKTYDKKLAKTIYSTIAKMLGNPLNSRISECSKNQNTLKKILERVFSEIEKSNTEIIPFQNWKKWQTLAFYDFKSELEILEKLKKKNIEVSIEARNLIYQIISETKLIESEVDLVLISNFELGFKKTAGHQEIYDRGIKLGLKLCDAQIGVQLCMQYDKQPQNEWLNLAMKPIYGLNSEPGILQIGKTNSQSRLIGGNAHPNHVWGSNTKWVFQIRHGGT